MGKMSVAIGVRALSPSPSLILAQLVAFGMLSPTALFAPGLRNIPSQCTPVKPDEPEMCGNLWYLLCRRPGQPDRIVAVGRMPQHSGGSWGGFGLHKIEQGGALKLPKLKMQPSF